MIRRSSAIGLAGLLLIGCQSLTAELAPAEVPTVTVGERFTWRRGEQEWTAEVVGIDHAGIDWKSTDGGTWTTHANFALAASRWTGIREHGEGQQEASGIEGDLFPLQSAAPRRCASKARATRIRTAGTKPGPARSRVRRG